MVESISHCVHSVDTNTVLPHTTKLLASLPDLSPHQVSVQWLVESLKLGRPAPESDFTFPALTAREDYAQPEPLPPPPRRQVEAEAGGNDTTHFERRLLAQYGGDMTGTRTGKSPTYILMFVFTPVSLQRILVRSFPFWRVKS